MHARLPVAAFALLLFAACGRSEETASEALVEKALEAQTGQKVDVESEDGQQTYTLETEDGTYTASTGAGVRMPEQFGDDVRLPPDAVLITAMSLGPAASVSLRSEREIGRAFDEFRRAQVAAGWTESSVMRQDPVHAVVFDKDSRRLTASFVAEAGNGATISLSVQPHGR